MAEQQLISSPCQLMRFSVSGDLIGRDSWSNRAKYTCGIAGIRVAYSITETAKLNNLNQYYFCHRFSELAELSNVKGYKDTNALEPTALDDLLPWSTRLPKECYKERR